MLHERVTAFGTNIDQAVKRISLTYTAKGMVETISSHDDATVGSGSVLNEVKREYNDFGQLTSEYQEHSGAVNTGTSLKVQYGYADGSSHSNVVRGTGMTYPDGRAISYDYGTSGGIDDLLSRIVNLKENTTTLASYTQMGGGGSVRIDLPQPQLRLDFWGGTSGSYAGLDRFNRLVDQHWTNTGTSTDIDQFQYGYDRNSNRVFKDNLLTSLRDEFYTYDSLNRLASFDRGDLNTGRTAISGTPEKEQDYTLDPLGNWLGFLTKSSGTTDLDQSRTHSKANEISGISETTGPAWVDPVQDRAGNMTGIPKPSSPTNTFTAIYDAWNRLVEVKEGTDTVVKYKYDGTSGRIIKETYSGGNLNETRHYYFSSGWRLLEERVGTSTSPRRQYLWGGRYVDELIFRDRDTNTDGTLDERLYAVQDGNFNVTAITDTSGAVVERYSYSPYGERTILTSSWGSRSSSSYSWEVGHQGLVHDAETGLVANRYRYLHPLLGRFISRDPIGYLGGSMSLYEYVDGSPIVYVDPLGLQKWYQGWGNTVYVMFGGEGSQAAGEVWTGAGEGAIQGGANAVNGAQDAVIGVVNIPAAVINSATGANLPQIPSPDWSYGLIYNEGCTAHNVSKFLGGQGLLTLGTLGASQLGNARHLTHVTNAGRAGQIATDASAGVNAATAGISGSTIYATARPTYSVADAVLTGTGRYGGYVEIPAQMMGGFRPIPAVGPISGWARFAGGGYVYGQAPSLGAQVLDAAVGQGLIGGGQAMSQQQNCGGCK